MAVIYLSHPTHGTKVACSSMEADFDETNGWHRYDINKTKPTKKTTNKLNSTPDFLADTTDNNEGD